MSASYITNTEQKGILIHDWCPPKELEKNWTLKTRFKKKKVHTKCICYQLGFES